MKRESESYYGFSNDFMFCTVLYHNKDLCKELIEVLLDVKVRETNASPEWRKERMTLEMKLKDVLEEGKIQGREEGREEGKKDTLIMLVKEKLLAAKDAANQLGITEEAFLNLMNGNS